METEKRLQHRTDYLIRPSYVSTYGKFVLEHVVSVVER